MDTESLDSQILSGIADYRFHNAARLEAAITVGGLLLEMRTALKHGEFGPYVAGLDIEERTARNWIAVARTGFKSETVSDLGGLKAILAALSGRQHPINRIAAETYAEHCPADETALVRDLADSMAATGWDSRSAILIAPDLAGGCGILDGFARYRAAREAKVLPQWKALPLDVHPYDAWYRENIERKHLSIEERKDIVARAKLVITGQHYKIG